ncbi:M56 family metallopeptidase [Polyangium aurulentum]|uniref:M56 family metallopeptidase n=1 Tax=Polyangium aurulentum TaxID=2567896 RepID=UPI0010AE4E37|nr:M56 family metallopeptidase [Polyangium aurulentum]UQA61262.1 transglycosylase SLT domain-containing protein [Polyangium aurulentum]
MSFVALAHSPLIEAIGLALLHFLWQGAVIAILLAAALATLPRTHAAARYAAACSALGLMALAPLFTLLFFWTSHAASGGALVPEEIFSTAPPPPPSGPSWIAVLVLVWMTGALFMSARVAVGFLRLQAVIRRHAVPVPRALQARLDRIARRMGLRQRVRLLASTRIDVPIVIGWLRPVVLVPLAALTALPPPVLGALLAHELAHVRRLDFLVNVLQSLLEAVLFYHPAVHWVSRIAREERENGCDDAAVQAVGDPVRYARALTELEVMRAKVPELALGSNGGSLVMRIRRLIDKETPRPASSRAFAAPALVIASSFGLALATMVACGGEPAQPSPTAQTAPAATLGIPWLPPALARWDGAIVSAAQKNGVDPDAIAIVALVESAGDPEAKSPVGALGLMQIMPKTAARIAEERGIANHSEARLLEPAYNLDLGAFYFGKQVTTFGKENPDRAIEIAAAAYNGGEKSVREWLDGKGALSEETERYRALVRGMWEERRAARSTTYDTWRERVRARVAAKTEPLLAGARVTRPFDRSAGAQNEGIDLAASPGATVHAPLDGTVRRVERDAAGGEVLVMEHGRGFETRIARLSAASVKPGQKVTRGEAIGSAGEAVHFEVRDNGEPIDPAGWLGSAGK